MTNKFIKIPIDKLLSKIPNKYKSKETIIFNKSQQAMVEGLNDHRFWVHISARRTGKSYAASIIALAKLLEPNQFVTVVAPNYSLSSIIWDYVVDLIEELKIEKSRLNQKERIVKLINGSVFRLLSANNRESLIGRGAHLLIIDEAAIIDDDEYFTRDLRPALSTFEGSRALFISTPRGKMNYLYDYYMRGENPDFPDWGSDLYDWTANPNLREDDIEDARRTLTSDIFRQEYYCDWASFEGQIYKIDRDKHIINSNIIAGDMRYQIIAGLDIGYRDSTAMVVLAKDMLENSYTIVDCYKASGMSTSMHAEFIGQLANKWNIESIYIDSAAAQTRQDLAYDHGIFCESSVKSVSDGIAYVQNLIEKDKLLIDESCFEVYQSIAGYRWNVKTEIPKPIHDEFSHYNDALRYAIYTNERKQVTIFGGGNL